MKKSYLHAFSVLTLAVALLSGCRSEVQLDNVDTTIEAQMQLALPIGSINAKVSDFLGTSDSAEFYIDTIGGENVVTYHRSMTYEKELSEFDIKSKIGSKTYYVNIYDMIKDATCDDGQGHTAPLIDAGGNINVPAGFTYSDTLDFAVPLIIDDVNKEGTELRVDSARFTHADFFVKVTRSNFQDLNWAWIDTVKVDLTDQIKYKPSRMMTVYKRGDNATWGAKLNAKLNEVLLDMMKDHSYPPTSGKVYNNIPFHVYVIYTIPGGTVAHVANNSGLDCEFGTDSLDVKAVWGWFSNGMVPYNQTININYSPFNFLNTARLPLANPIIDGTLRTKIAGALKLEAEINATDAAGKVRRASWNGSTIMRKTFTEGAIDPSTSPLDAEAQFTLHFDGTEANGNIDTLLAEMPRQIYYNISAGFDKETTPQVRVAGDAYLRAEAIAKVPIEFHKDLKIDYTDTIKGIKLDRASIDSLLDQVNWLDSLKTTNVHVFVKVTNGIPLDIKGTFYCLDKDGNELMDPENPSKHWTIFDGDTLLLAGASYDGAGNIIPKESITGSALTRAKIDLFPKISQIVYYAYVTDDAVKASPYNKGAKITGANNVKVALGLTADLDAILNLNNIGKDNKNGNK